MQMIDENRSKLGLRDKAGIIALGRLFSSISHLLVAIILARLLTKSDYGSFRQVWLIYNVFLLIFSSGIPMSAYYFLGHLKDNEKKGFVLQTVLLLTVLGAIFSGCLYLFSGLIAAKFNNSDLEYLFKLFSLYPLFTLPILCAETILISFDLPKVSAWITFLTRTTMVVSSIVPVLLGYALETVFKVLVVLSIFQLIYVIFQIWRPVRRFSLEWHPRMLISQIRYSVPLGVSYVFQMLMLQIDKIMVSVFFIASTFAIYSNGAFEIPFTGIITGSAVHVLMPELVKRFKNGEKDSLLLLWHGSITKVALLLFPLAVFLFVFSSEFIVTLFSEKYTGSVVIFSIYLLFIPVRITDYGAVLLAMGYSGTVMKFYVLASIVNVALNYAFIKALGFVGPAISTVLVSYLLGLFLLREIKARIGVKFSEILPWKVLVKLMMVCGLGGLAVFPLSLIEANPAVILVIGVGCYIVISGVFLRVCGLIEDGDILLVKRWLRVLHMHV